MNHYHVGVFARRQLVKGKTIKELDAKLERMKNFKQVGKPKHDGFVWVAVMEYEGDKKNG